MNVSVKLSQLLKQSKQLIVIKIFNLLKPLYVHNIEQIIINK